jgi:hypothetical protein
MDLPPIIRRAQLADTTSAREGAALVGTDTKTGLGNATTVEAALTWLDSFAVSTADIFGLVDLKMPPGDPFEIRSNYGLTVTRQGDIIFVDLGDGTDGTGPATVSGGQGITVAITGDDYKVHMREERVVLTDGATVTLDGTNDNNFILPMGASPGDRTIAFSNFSRGQKFTLMLKNGGSNTVTWPTIKWPGGTTPTLSSTANRGDLFGFEKQTDDTYLGFTLGQDYSL